MLKSADHEMEQPVNGRLDPTKPTIVGVFDGMGGEERGEMASLITANTASQTLIGKEPAKDLAAFCIKANERICTFAANNGISSMGTTAAALVFSRKKVFLCNIGDSKIFRFSHGALEQISFDHLAPSAHGVKPPLSQSLGIPPSEFAIEPYFAQGECVDNDMYLICSDGLTDMLSSDEISVILRTTAFEDTVAKLMQQALDRGGKDNITIILCAIKKQKLSLLNWLYDHPADAGRTINKNKPKTKN